MARLYISAAHKSSGKTTISAGLCAALSERGLIVQPYKKGPDYIDPLWLTRACGRPCINLDFNTMDAALLLQRFDDWHQAADLALIEGNKGLFDGVAIDGSDSNAAMAKLLNTPVVLVIDAQGITRGVAPLLQGYLGFDPQLHIAGVILNKVATARHESKLRQVIAAYTDIPVLGAVPRQPQLTVRERHLGLVPSNEERDAGPRVLAMAAAVHRYVDLDALLSIAAAVAPIEGEPNLQARPALSADVRIGIPRDRVFGFYYPDDLAALCEAGAELVFFDSLQDRSLPAVDGLFIGGGFPETHLDGLSANHGLRRDIGHFAREGGPVYAECGGLMYLARSVSWNGKRAPMAGALPLDISMEPRPVGRGYVRLRETGSLPWGRIRKGGGDIAAHEFHHSRIDKLDDGARFAYRVIRGFGIDGHNDGLLHRRVVACYAHLRNMPPVLWANRFVDYVRQVKH
jgi:cobyrinic acid a,c-diamide synthase